MKYIVASQNLIKGGIKLPSHVILRVNLAWHNCLESVKDMLKDHSIHDIFLDMPIGRKKPPNHNHDLERIAEIANTFSNVKYLAISNVETGRDIKHYSSIFKCKIVPKIETYKGIIKLEEIIDALNYKPQILMLDHEDLFSNLVLLKKEREYLNMIGKIVDICKKKKAHLLRAKGIIFSNY